MSGQPLDRFFKKRIFKPLQMKDTAFHVAAAKAKRFAACYSPKPAGGLKLTDDPAKSKYLAQPSLLSGGGGLVSTAADYMRFCQMLLNKGELIVIALSQYMPYSGQLENAVKPIVYDSINFQ